MNYLQIAMVIIKLYPIIRELMGIAEREVPGNGQGAVKKEFVQRALCRVVNADPETANDNDQIMFVVEGIIDDVAAMAKRAGEALFK